MTTPANMALLLPSHSCCQLIPLATSAKAAANPLTLHTLHSMPLMYGMVCKPQQTSPFMAVTVTHTICKGLELHV